MFSGNKIYNILQKFTPPPTAFKTCTLQLKYKTLLQYKICYYKTLKFPEHTNSYSEHRLIFINNVVNGTVHNIYIRIQGKSQPHLPI